MIAVQRSEAREDRQGNRLKRMANTPQRKAPEVCPVCGEDVPRKALACPECGADHNSGWRENAGLDDGAGVDDGGFDYDEFIREEFGSGVKPRGISTIWWITAALVTAVMILLFVLR